MKTVKLILCLFTATMIFSSCSSDDSDTKSVQYYNRCFHHVYNVMSGTYKIYDAPQYEFEFNYTDATANVEIKNVKFADGMPAISLKLVDLKWGVNQGFKRITATDVIPVVDGEPMPEYTLNNVKIELLDRYIGLNYEPIVNVYFVINNMFKVTAVQKEIIYFGQTTVTSGASSTPFVSAEQIHKLSINKELTAKLEISGAKFAQGMPSLDMVFKNIDVEIGSGVGYTLKSETIIPEINEVPYPNYEITSLSGDGLFSSGLSLKYDCNISKKADDGSVVIMPPYMVKSVLVFDVPTE